jgi:tripartite-type tricarboxylate transporter receptor subunit TctC
VPYRGVGPALADLVGGRIPMLLLHIAAPIGFLQRAELRGLAVTPPQRVAALPGVPPAAELGFRGFENAAWIGIMAPPGLPRPIAERLSRELVAMLEASVAGTAAQGGVAPVPGPDSVRAPRRLRRRRGPRPSLRCWAPRRRRRPCRSTRCCR